jgi:hypothetical protein
MGVGSTGTFISFGFVCTNFWGDENSSLLFFFIGHVIEAMNLDDESQ